MLVDVSLEPDNTRSAHRGIHVAVYPRHSNEMRRSIEPLEYSSTRTTATTGGHKPNLIDSKWLPPAPAGGKGDALDRIHLEKPMFLGLDNPKANRHSRTDLTMIHNKRHVSGSSSSIVCENSVVTPNLANMWGAQTALANRRLTWRTEKRNMLRPPKSIYKTAEIRGEDEDGGLETPQYHHHRRNLFLQGRCSPPPFFFHHLR